MSGELGCEIGVVPTRVGMDRRLAEKAATCSQ